MLLTHTHTHTHAEAQISAEDALEVLRVGAPGSVGGWGTSIDSGSGGGNGRAVSATALYEAQRRSKRIVTFCADFDRVLGGGVAAGQVTEFCECVASCFMCKAMGVAHIAPTSKCDAQCFKSTNRNVLQVQSALRNQVFETCFA
eukprot:364027-Chlamydomonas_euryale.AAC.5